MFSKLAIVVLATAGAVSAQMAASQCNVKKLKCCEQVQQAGSAGAQKEADTIGVVLGDIKGLLGFNCSPITGLGIGGGATCNANPVCCKDVKFNGLVNVGCTTVNLNL